MSYGYGTCSLRASSIVQIESGMHVNLESLNESRPRRRTMTLLEFSRELVCHAMMMMMIMVKF